MLQAAVEAIDKAKSEDRTRGFEEFGNAWNGLSESLAKTMNILIYGGETWVIGEHPRNIIHFRLGLSLRNQAFSGTSIDGNLKYAIGLFFLYLNI